MLVIHPRFLVLTALAFTSIAAGNGQQQAAPNPFAPQQEAAPSPPPHAKAAHAHAASGFQTYTDPVGGGHLRFVRSASGSGAQAAMRQFLGTIDGQTNHTMKLLIASTDGRDSVVHVLLTARLGGQQVLGVAVTVVAPGETVSGLFYGPPAVLKSSYRNLSAYFSRQIPASPAGQEQEEHRIPPPPNTASWRRQSGGDGSTSVLLPTGGGWRVTGVAKGAADVRGPHGEAMEFGLGFPILTHPLVRGAQGTYAPYMSPAQAMQWYAATSMKSQGATVINRQPARSLTGRGQTEYVVLSLPWPGNPSYKLLALVSTSSISQYKWLLYMSYASAPADKFDEELPTMLAIWKNWKIDPAFQAERLAQIARTQAETRRIQAGMEANITRLYDNVNEGWDEIIRDVTTVEGGDGERTQVPNGVLGQLGQECQRQQIECHEVPIQQLVP